MEANYYVGVDISKDQLDWQINNAQNQQLTIGKAPNKPNGIGRMLDRWSSKGHTLNQMVICFEHTGAYGLLLAVMLEQAGVRYVIASAADVQRSLGIRRARPTPLMRGGWLNTSGGSGTGCIPAVCHRPDCLPCADGLCGVRNWLKCVQA